MLSCLNLAARSSYFAVGGRQLYGCCRLPQAWPPDQIPAVRASSNTNGSSSHTYYKVLVSQRKYCQVTKSKVVPLLESRVCLLPHVTYRLCGVLSWWQDALHFTFLEGLMRELVKCIYGIMDLICRFMTQSAKQAEWCFSFACRRGDFGKQNSIHSYNTQVVSIMYITVMYSIMWCTWNCCLQI